MSQHIVPLELHLRLLPVDEALYRLEQYLSDAFMAGHPRVRIVHGKGSGAVRNAVWERLAQHPLVRSYDLALPGAGDRGVTVVDLEASGLLPPAPPRVPRRTASHGPDSEGWRRP